MSINHVAARLKAQTIESPSKTGPASCADPHLTAEGLLLYCQTQLASLDGDIKGMMEEQTRNLDRKKALADVENAMKKAVPPKTEEQKQEVLAALDAAIASLPEGDDTRLMLEGMRKEVAELFGVDAALRGMPRDPLHASPDLITPLKKERWEAEIDELKNKREEVSGNAEITMIRLQSLISQRQTAVQLTTNMMAKIEKAPELIVGNMR